MLSSEGASVFVSSLLSDLAQLPDSARAARIAAALDWWDLAPVVVGPGWEDLDDGQRETFLDALTDYVAKLVAELPLREATLVITDSDLQDRRQFRVMTSAPVDQEASEITFWVFERPGKGMKIGNVGVEGVSFLGRHRHEFTALVESQGIDALIKHLREKTAPDRQQQRDPVDAPQPPQQVLPSRQQLAEVRDFLHGRAYAAAGVALQPAGEPPHAEGSPVADARHVSRALYMVVNMLSRRVLDAAHSGRAGDDVHSSWGALLLVAHEWRDSPDMPESLKALVGAYFPRSS